VAFEGFCTHTALAILPGPRDSAASMRPSRRSAGPLSCSPVRRSLKRCSQLSRSSAATRRRHLTPRCRKPPDGRRTPRWRLRGRCLGLLKARWWHPPAHRSRRHQLRLAHLHEVRDACCWHFRWCSDLRVGALHHAPESRM